MSSRQESTITRILVGLLFTAVLAGNWDVWWHGAVGRDSFWEPPHILLYSSVTAAVLIALYAWRMFGGRQWRNFTLLLLLVPLSAPIDDAWHRMFGLEAVNDPVIIWSPPHLLLVFALAAACVYLLNLLRNETDVHIRWLGSCLLFATIFSLLLFPTIPIQPCGAFQLLGFYGAGIIAAIFIGHMFFIERFLKQPGSILLSFFIFLVIHATLLTRRFAPGVLIAKNDVQPEWLIIFAFLVPALFMELTPKLSAWLRGGIAAGLWAGILYGFSSPFLLPEFQYSNGDALTAIATSIGAGLVIGLIYISIINFPKLKTINQKL
ncbi:MAG: hypothetical protein JWM56_830 [Candidatus Peribacteria bacterium]|nr:hypothetical protein [Candidatus Peribacteria bacterium]